MLHVHIRRRLGTVIARALFLSTFVWSNASSVAAMGNAGAVYALTNAPTGNAVVAWNRAADGTLSLEGTFATGGLGTGGGLGPQGALILSPDRRWLFAVDAGSHEISTFRVHPDGLTLAGRVASGGTQPTSLTIHGNLLYVLNAGASGNITGFTVGADGSLSPLAGSTRSLSSSATAPAQVQFSPNGRLLAVTERATNMIDLYTVDESGIATGPVSYPAAGITPFGFAFSNHGYLIVSEAFGGIADASAVSSYAVDADNNLQTISPSAATHQTAACWIVVTNNGRYAYTSNAGSGSISGYSIGQDGSLTLLNANGRTGDTGVGSGPADMALSINSQYLYVRNGQSRTVGAFAVQSDGSLQSLGAFNGLPAGSAGLAAYYLSFAQTNGNLLGVNE